MPDVRFGLRIPPCAPVDEVARCVGAAEAAGFDVAWIPDSQLLWRDVWATTALAATRTDRIDLGTCVTNFETRHVSVTASAAATIADLAPGRLVLGVGSGDSSVKTLGLEPTRLARMREQIATTRRLLAGEELDFDGRLVRLRHAPAAGVPVYLAANGPKAVALAGEAADGLITVAGLAPDMVGAVRSRVEAAAGLAGRDAAGIEICFGTFCHVADDVADAARAVKPYVVAMAQLGGREALRSIGIDIQPPAVVDGVYPDLSHAEDWDRAADVAGRWVTDEMAVRYADVYCLVGSVDVVVERLRRAVAAGATSFYLRHFGSYSLPWELVGAFGEGVLPRFR